MPNLSKRALALQESAIRALEHAVARQTGVSFLHLNIGQPDLPTPAPLAAAIQAFQPPVFAYGPSNGVATVREAAAAYHSRWSPGLDSPHVAVTTGGSEALLFALMVTCDPGDEVLVPEPFYTNYRAFAQMAGASVRGVYTSLEEGFAIPPDDVLDRMVTARTRAVMFSNPGNPTGAVYPAANLERLVAWATRRDLFVISDEVYRRIWFGAPPPSALELPDAADRVLVVDSLSKTYSACGLRVGFLISRNEELMRRVERLGQARLGPQPLAQHAALAALQLPESHYEETRRTYARRVDTLMTAIARIPGARAPRPDGAFYTMIHLPVDDAARFARFLVEEFRVDGESVVLAPGGGFYSDPAAGRQEVRVAAVLDEARMDRALRIVGAAVEAFPGRTGPT